jgi:hypothetical protein
MRTLPIVASILLLAACGSEPVKREPTPEEVQKGVRYTVVFGIVPDEKGTLVGFRFVSTTDLRTREKVTFVPSDKFVAQAKEALSNGLWKVTRNDDGSIKEVYMYCLYSTVVPDSAVCDAKFAKKAP